MKCLMSLMLFLVQTIYYASAFNIDTEDPFPCELEPQLRVVNPVSVLKKENVTRNEEKNELYVPGLMKLILRCTSSFPIDFNIDGHLMYQYVNVEMKREIRTKSTSGYCYSITIQVMTTREATGNYSCQNIANQSTHPTSLYLYSNGEHSPYLLHGNLIETIKVKPSAGDPVVILPCVTTNPNTSVALYKVEFQKFELLTKGDHLSYDPKVGFYLHLNKFPDPFGKYECVARNSEHYNVFVHVMEPAEERMHDNEHSMGNINMFLDDQRYFVCTSEDVVSVISSINCSNPIECKILEKCLKSPDCTEPHSCKCLQRGYSCSKSFKIQKNVTLDGCARIPTNTNGGTVICSSKNRTDSKIIRYFRGLSGNIVTNWTKESVINDVLRVSSMFNHSDTIFYVGEEIEFICVASPFVFSMGFKWFVRLSNGTLMHPKLVGIPSLVQDEKTGIIKEKVKIVISNPNIVGIVCVAPMWNDLLWINATETLAVKDSVMPEFVDPTNVTIVISIHDHNHTLNCAARGFPQPDLIWLKNGEEFITDFHYDNSVDNITKSMIVLKEFSLSDDGSVYTCNASNPRGQIFKTFTVDVYQSPTTLVFSLTGFAVFICFSLIITLFFTLCRNFRSKNIRYIFHMSDVDIEEFENGNPEVMKTCSDEYQKALYLPYDKNVEIRPENLIIDYTTILGQGEFGVVLKGKLIQNPGSVPVAIKTVKGSSTNHLKSLLSELKIRIYIGNHDNVVNLLGAVTKHIVDRNVSVVLEYCHFGSIEKYLRGHRNAFLNEFAPDGSRLCTNSPQENYVRIEYLVKTTDLILWACQIAKGMEFLVSKKVIHGDLAARNILLTENHVVKITDFGLSKNLYNYANNYVTKRSDVPLPWRWLSLEALRDQSFSVHSDIWAYGVTLWELFSLAETPYPGVVFNEDFLNNLIEGQRLGKPKYSNYEIYRIMKECWSLEPKERPSFSALRYSFQQLLPSDSSQTESDTDGEETQVVFSDAYENREYLLPHHMFPRGENFAAHYC